MKRSHAQRRLKYGMGVFISVLSLSASLSSSHHALAAQGLPAYCYNYPEAVITSASSNNVLSSSRPSDGSFVVLNTANGKDRQKWNFVPINTTESDCVYQIISVRTGGVLTIEDLHHNHASVFLANHNGSENQLWIIMPASDANSHNAFGSSDTYSDFYKIMSVKNGKMLGVTGSSVDDASVILSSDNGGLAQIWYIAPNSPNSPNYPVNPGGPNYPVNPGGPNYPENPGFPNYPINSGAPSYPVAPVYPGNSGPPTSPR